MQTNKKLSIILSVIILSLIILSIFKNQYKYSDRFRLITIAENWQYRIGDSPRDSSGQMIWLKDSLNSVDWSSAKKISDIPVKGCKSLWIRTSLPDTNIVLPALYLNTIQEIVQVYFNGEKIYQFGEFDSTAKDHFVGLREHLIPLPEDFGNGVISFRIWSGNSSIGITPPVWLGAADKIQTCLFVQNADELIVALIYLFLGIVLLVIFLFFRKSRLLLGIDLFLLTLSVYIFAISYYLQSIIYAPRLFFIINYFSFFSLPFAAYFLIEEIIDNRYKLIFRRFWQVHLAFILLAILPVVIYDYNFIKIIIASFFVLISVSVIISTILIIKNLKTGRRDITLLFIGLLIFYFFAYSQLVVYYLGRLATHVTWIHFGSVGFVICLAWIVIDRYAETKRQSEIAREKALEAENYKEINQIKSRFFANISHEFRTPLTLILGAAKQILNNPEDDFVQEKSLLQIKNGQRLLKLVNELLDLSKLDEGQLKLKIISRDIVKHVREICSHFESYAENKNVQIILNSQIHQTSIFYDPEKIEKVLVNLLSNAVKFTKPDGHIVVSVFRNDCLEISIKDTGPGISEKDLAHIFDRFYQAENGYTQDGEGSGIGLALASELVRMHHGQILVESEIGKGSTFIVQLPLDAGIFSDEEVQNHSDENFCTSEDSYNFVPMLENMPAPITTEFSKKNDKPIILVVEDNSDLRNYISEIFMDDYQFIKAENGEEGLEMAINFIPDLIISDVMMPKMDGYQLCEKLKTDERTSHVPIILLTARSDKQSRIEGLKFGADDYLTKPFDADELNVRIQNLVEQRRKMRERFSKEITSPIKEFAIMPADEQFLLRIVEVIESNLNNSKISVEWLSGEVGLSRSQLHRKIKALTNQAPSEFIRSIRLKYAKKLLESGVETITNIAYMAGFSSPEYFRRCFKQQFGESPSKYQSKL